MEDKIIPSEVTNHLTPFSVDSIDKLREILGKQRNDLHQKQTPKDYIKEKPVGKGKVAYVPAAFMDSRFKEHFPIYDMAFSFPPFMFQNWIIVGVNVTDKVTGNTELGLKAHRIQIAKEKRLLIEEGRLSMSDVTPFDIIDLGNDVSAALSEAIKNAQSRFGVCADVYRKIIIDDEKLIALNEEFWNYVRGVDNPLTRRKLTEEWSELKPENKEEFLKSLKKEN